MDPEAGSPADRRHARRCAVGLVAGPLLFALVLAFPIPLARDAHTVLALFVWTVTYWVTEALPIPATALLSSAAAIALGIAPARVVLASYGDPVIFLFVGSFILAEGMKASGLDRRLAFAVLRLRAATRTPSALMLAVGTTTCALSLWVSNTATTAMMLPVALGLLRVLGHGEAPGPGRPATGLLLMLTWSSSVAVGIPVGSPPNLIAIGMVRDLTDRRLTFFDWVAVGMPLTVVMLLACWAILRWRYGGAWDAARDLEAHVDAERRRLGPWSRAEGNVLAVFLFASVLWVLPGAVLVAAPRSAAGPFLERHLPESAVALLAAVLLFALPTDLGRGEFTLTWKRAARIDWGTILLFGGGLALGRLMFDTKLAEAIGTAAVRLSGAQSVWTLTAVAIVIGVLLSETSSNTAAATMAIPVVIAIAQSAGLSPVPPALGAALGASFGFMLPVSTPPNAIVYGSGLVPLREMMKAGIVLDAVGMALIWLGLRILCSLFGVM